MARSPIAALVPETATMTVETSTFGASKSRASFKRVPLNERDRAVALTKEGRDLLERHRSGNSHRRQAFYAGADRARTSPGDNSVTAAPKRYGVRSQRRPASDHSRQASRLTNRAETAHDLLFAGPR